MRGRHTGGPGFLPEEEDLKYLYRTKSLYCHHHNAPGGDQPEMLFVFINTSSQQSLKRSFSHSDVQGN